MTPDDVRRMLLRDLAALRRELEAYEPEADIWALPAGVTNSAGTLALHLAGNLQHFVGAQLGATGYVRNRDAEFGDRNVPRSAVLAEVQNAATAVDRALSGFPDSRLAEPYPLEVGGVRLSTGLFLLHLAAHLTYHLGQIDYHRRIVTGTSRPIGALAIPELAPQ